MIKASTFLACVFVLGCVLSANAASFKVGDTAEVAETNTNGTRVKRAGFLFNYYYPYYSYYNWYYIYPSNFAVSTCSSSYACPTQCPGTCGTYAGLFACRCNSCPSVGNLCTNVAINAGNYLFAYPYDSARYVQCDPSPGLFYIRNCPDGLVFDSRYGVCNYAAWIYGKK